MSINPKTEPAIRLIVALFAVVWGINAAPALAQTTIFSESFEGASGDFPGALPTGWTLSIDGEGASSVGALSDPGIQNIDATNGVNFGIIDTRGNTPTTEFRLGPRLGTAGSKLVSSPFPGLPGDVISLDFNFLTKDFGGFFPQFDFGFIQLRVAGAGEVVATLANANTTANPFFNPNPPAVPAQGGPAPAISDGVTLSPPTAFLDGDLNGKITGPVNGVVYDSGGLFGRIGGSTGFINSTFTIPDDAPDGPYEFFFVVSDVANEFIDSGLAFDNITVIRLQEPQASLDHFLLYEAEVADGDDHEDEVIQIVSLSDQFDDPNQSRLFEVEEVERLGNPADVNDEGTNDSKTHLVGYEIERISGAPKHQRISGIVVTNQFGEITLDTKKPKLLLVPSLKDLIGPIDDADLPDSFPVDHFKCYGVKVTKGTPDFERVRISVLDQFGQPALLKVLKPKWLCNPVQIDITEIGNPEEYLLCYKVKRAKRQPKFEEVEGIHINNQFGPLWLEAEKEKELCLPSETDLESAVLISSNDDDDDEDDDDHDDDDHDDDEDD